MNDLIRVGIIGGTDYLSGELLQLMLNHPVVDIVFIYNEFNTGRLISDVHHSLLGETSLRFSEDLLLEEVDIIFLGNNKTYNNRFLSEHYVPADVRILELASDVNLSNEENDFIYGLPELNSLQLCGAQFVTNPGCLASCALLSLLPLAAQGWLDGDISINAIAGTTAVIGSGQDDDCYTTRYGNISIEQAFEHPQLDEIYQGLHKLQPSFDAPIDIITYRGNFPRGIFASVVTHCDIQEERIVDAYEKFYEEASFTHLVTTPIDLKQIVNTNKCLTHLEKHDEKLLITTCIDNLLKGGAGQAVQNMNLMFGLEETTGLRLKPVVF